MRRSSLVLIASLWLAAAAPAAAREAPPATPAANPLIDYSGYVALTEKVGPYRAKRLLGLAEFRRRAASEGALLLDARSAEAFGRGHIRGAVNLPFPDFTADSLAQLVGPDRSRPIYIYCNNNFRNNVAPVVTKSIRLALNVQTFVNLVGYGYPEVWELGEAVDLDDPAVGWVRG
jgi:rhodanese-related sulfurtransferase